MEVSTFKRRKSLTLKLILGINLCSFCLLMLFHTIGLFREKKESIHSTETAVETLLEVISYPATTLLWNMDNEMLAQIAQSLKGRDNVDFVMFFDKDEKALTELPKQETAYTTFTKSRPIKDKSG